MASVAIWWVVPFKYLFSHVCQYNSYNWLGGTWIVWKNYYPVLEDASTTSTVKQMSPRPRTNLVCQHQRQYSLCHPILSTSYGLQSGSGCVHNSDVNWPPYWKHGKDNISCSDHALHCSLLWFLRAQVTWLSCVMTSIIDDIWIISSYLFQSNISIFMMILFTEHIETLIKYCQLHYRFNHYVSTWDTLFKARPSV